MLGHDAFQGGNKLVCQFAMFWRVSEISIPKPAKCCRLQSINVPIALKHCVSKTITVTVLDGRLHITTADAFFTPENVDKVITLKLL
jgi:hypothetical protein